MKSPNDLDKLLHMKAWPAAAEQAVVAVGAGVVALVIVGALWLLER
jgi:hypothetical protein